MQQSGCPSPWQQPAMQKLDQSGKTVAPFSGANITGSSSSPSASAGFQSGTMGAL